MDEAVLKKLAAIAPTSTNADVLRRHGAGESHHDCLPPDVVFYAQSTEDVAACAALCSALRVPMIAFGAGTSLEGHVTAPHGGVCIDLSQMNAVLEENAVDMDCKVQSGVTRLALNTSLRHTGLGFMVDPGADASIGGMVATGASGTAAVRYGTMRENTLGLTAVLADGRVVRTGTRARKSSAGYDLTRLLVGSEGTLAIITEVALKLHPIPSHESAACVAFASVHDAAEAVVAILASGLQPVRCELLDATTLVAFNRYNLAKKDALPSLREVPHLFLEFAGVSEASVAEQAEIAKDCCEALGATQFTWATDAAERAALWAARHSTYYAALALRPGAKGFVTDACVPLSLLGDAIAATVADVEAYGVVGPVFGHAGDGNFHCILSLQDDESPEYTAAVHAVNDRLIKRTLAAGGTCTGEHGIGSGKKKYLPLEFGQNTVDMMCTIKESLDPHNLLNPGKIIDIKVPID